MLFNKEIEEKVMSDIAFDGTCPFCGSKMELIFREGICSPRTYGAYYTGQHENTRYRKYISSSRLLYHCLSCDAMSPSIPVNMKIVDKNAAMDEIKHEIALAIAAEHEDEYGIQIEEIDEKESEE